MKVLAAVCFALTGAALVFVFFALGNLWIWTDKGDSPDSTYIETAAVFFGIALLFAAVGIAALRRG